MIRLRRAAGYDEQCTQPTLSLYPPVLCFTAGESGGRADVRWLALTAPGSDSGLLAAAVGAGSSLQVGSGCCAVAQLVFAMHVW